MTLRRIEGNDIPPPLRELPQPPAELYVEGTLPNFDSFAYLSVVGSRRFSRYGRDACERLIAGLAGYPIVIVSGLAIGIDALAHRAALAAKLPTVAFPGSGLDRSVLYPRSHVGLAEEILAAGGALISEFEPKTRAAVHTFPRRNRLMAGVSRAVLVIEAAEKSGTLITARLATEYNRDVFVVPGSIFSENAKGSNALIRLGAMPVSSSADILVELGFDAPRPKGAALPEGLATEELAVLEALREPLPRDTLIRALGLSGGNANALLMTMEIKGLIAESGGFIRRA